MDFSGISGGILYLECKVHYLVIKVAVMTEIAVAKVILLCDRK